MARLSSSHRSDRLFGVTKYLLNSRSYIGFYSSYYAHRRSTANATTMDEIRKCSIVAATYQIRYHRRGKGFCITDYGSGVCDLLRQLRF